MQVSLTDWNNFIGRNPQAHIMQHGAWGEFKQRFGWSIDRLLIDSSGVQIMIRRLPLGFKFAYVPKGPVGERWETLFPEIHKICRSRGVFFLKVEPDEWEPGNCTEIYRKEGFLPANSIQPQRSIVVDLRPDEGEILDRMKQKTRYNIRLAGKKEVKVKPSKDIKTFYELLLKTGERDRFGIHSLDYYQSVFNLFSKVNACRLFLAFYKNKPLAGIMVFCHGLRAWYFYGASSEEERERMPTYLLQWEGIRWAKSAGCIEYDLWGVPDEEEQILEENFTQKSDGLWGVYRFKRGFGGQLKRSAGAWDYVYSPLKYHIFQNLLKIKKIQSG